MKRTIARTGSPAHKKKSRTKPPSDAKLDQMIEEAILKSCGVAWGIKRLDYYTHALEAQDLTELKLTRFEGEAAHPDLLNPFGSKARLIGAALCSSAGTCCYSLRMDGRGKGVFTTSAFGLF